MRYYPAIVEKEADSDFGVFFPDFPGCVSAGPTMSEAVANAEAALALHIEGMIEDDEALPEPSAIESVAIDPEVRRVALVLVPARLPGNVRRVNITLDENLLADIDATAARLAAAGARFRNRIVDGVGGRQVLVEDPSGNPVELFQPTTDEAKLG